jgi:phosphoenolpyruvate-protein kinase (PTS system EI component)
VRAWVRALDHRETEQLARQALEASDAAEVVALVHPLAERG